MARTAQSAATRGGPTAHGFSLTGGCQCGAVRYRLATPALEVNHCHCSMCRKIHGALFASFARVAAPAFVLEKGMDVLARFRSSPAVERCFCPNCGCPLFIADADYPDRIWFAVATLDGGAHPGHPRQTERHIFAGSKVPWYEIADTLPQHEEF